MCKLVTMLSKDTVERLLLMRFCDLCSDARLFQVRKVTTCKPFQFLHFCFSYCTSELSPCKAAFYLYSGNGNWKLFSGNVSELGAEPFIYIIYI